MSNRTRVKRQKVGREDHLKVELNTLRPKASVDISRLLPAQVSNPVLFFTCWN